MDHAIYTAMGAANAALDRQAITSNNLANASTAGFRAQLAAFRAIPVQGPSVETRTLVTASTPYHDDSMGIINQTGRNLDVALPQNGWLAVALPDGSEAYTRAGNIEVNSEGLLSVRGLPVMGDGGQINAPPQAELTIAPDGTITARGAGDQPKALSPIGKLKMVNAKLQDLTRGDDGLFHIAPDSLNAGSAQLSADPSLQLIPGALESSNVNPATSMVDMIASARGFDMNMKVITTVDDNDKKANQLLSMS
ncbi:flagellar basal body rod protein FlgF [Buttiauxella warmboldiae]|uniref:Flagellar basal-body rod protein FlgF n=1 Tax=Buttiauxella warmboldiae TaxID=82993 RepID=A0A3N5DKR5_9ENTR|nr:flagellar basal body rod protein FlgF [Buttiauxella warmboldiae]RPH29235.1 flagellar basal body rod protein FlgF [Buttiauxella warmboldiae]